MREPENCSLSYCGFSSPRSTDEIDFEILGLQILIKEAERRMAELRQTKYLADLALKNECSTLSNLFEEEDVHS